MIPIVFVASLYGLRYGFVASLLSSSAILFLTRASNELAPSIFLICIFNLAPLAGFAIYKVLQKRKALSQREVDAAQQDYQRLLEKDDSVRDHNARLENEVLDMARLYEITKAMSVSMEFKGIFEIFRQVLQKVFYFSQARLILAEGKAYPIAASSDKHPAGSRGKNAKKIKVSDFLDSAKEEIKSCQLTQSDTDLLKACSENKKPIIKRDKLFAAVPLVSQGALVGVVSVENINPDEIDRFLIVSGQFGLELEKVRLYEMVQKLAIVDGLTGVFMRRHLLERFQDELRRSIRHKLSLSTLMVDIDRFKDCNDKYGHLVGDVILKTIADIIKENVREVDLVGRYGGEEFYIILPDTAKPGGLHVAGRLKKAVEKHTFLAYDEKVKATVSVGVSTFPEDASDLQQLIDRADEAMYRAKKQGRNQVVGY